jgi:predicted ester cyclase
VSRILVFLLLSLASVCAARAGEYKVPEASQEDRNKAVARRVFDEIFNQGRFEIADEIYAPDFVNHGLKRDFSLQEDQAAVHQEKAAFPDLKMSVELMVAEGDLVSVVWIFRGTHTHAGYGGLPPTGTKVEFRGITIWRIVDGRIREEWTAFDPTRAYIQLLSQMKWPLAGLVLAVLILGWGTIRGLRHLLARRRRNEQPGT